MTASRRATKRLVLLGVALLAGAVASVMSAWGAEVWASWRGPWRLQDSSFYVRLDRSNLVHEFRLLERFGSQLWSITPILDARGFELETRLKVPYWVILPTDDPNLTLTTCAYGFPLRCLRWSTITTLDPITRGSIS